MQRIRKWFGSRSAESVTPQEIERHFEEQTQNAGWAPSTVNHYRSLISLTYQLAIRNGKLKAGTNPARATRHRKEDNSRVRYLSSAEESKLRAVVEAKWPQHLAELDLALHTGLRRSEMYGLLWEDVDLARRFLRVRCGKNGDARYVRLNAIALKALTVLGEELASLEGAVVRGRSGDALRGPRHWFEKAIAEAEISNFHWHDLRHTFASRLAMKNVSIRAIQEALGHKSLAMTVRYSHLSPDFLQDAVDTLVPAETSDRTDTRTDTGANTLDQAERGSVH